jgi:hypothetical protein
LTEDEENLAEAELGEAARAFVQSDLGKCVIGMARQDAEAALAKLSTVDPNDSLKIVELQREAAFGNRFEQYLSELIHRGDNALAVLMENT